MHQVGNKNLIEVKYENISEPFVFYNKLINEVISILELDYSSTIKDLNVIKSEIEKDETPYLKTLLKYFECGKLVRNVGKIRSFRFNHFDSSTQHHS